MRDFPSRALDAQIFCAVHGVTDANSLTSPDLIEARARGHLLIGEGSMLGWILAPRYTSDLALAQSLIPEGISTISKIPSIVCATALTIMARTGVPVISQLRFPKEESA
jgi:hypothetical protein